MGVFVAALLFLVVAGVAFLIANRFVKRWRPKPQKAAQAIMIAISVSLVFTSVYFFTAWGFNPAVIQVNLQQSLNPLRWVNWLLSALSFGVAQAFIDALFRHRINMLRRLAALPPGLENAGKKLEDRPAAEAAVETEAAIESSASEQQTRPHASTGETERDGPLKEGKPGPTPLRLFARNRHGGTQT